MVVTNPFQTIKIIVLVDQTMLVIIGATMPIQCRRLVLRQPLKVVLDIIMVTTGILGHLRHPEDMMQETQTAESPLFMVGITVAIITIRVPLQLADTIMAAIRHLQ